MQGDEEPGPERVQAAWRRASPLWRLELPPYDEDAVLVDLESVEGFEDG